MMKPTLDTQGIRQDWNEVENIKELMEFKEKFIYLNMPPGTVRGVMRRKVLFRTMNDTTKTFKKHQLMNYTNILTTYPMKLTL